MVFSYLYIVKVLLMGNNRRIDIELKWYERVGFELLWAFCVAMSYMPRWFRYYLIKPIVLAVLHICRYRRRVITENLARSFPEKSEKERREIKSRFYNILAEIVVDTISLVTANPRRNMDLLVWANGEEHLKETAGRDWIAMASHYGCWEYYPLWCWHDTKTHFMSVYHPLKSKIFEAFYLRMRRFAPNIEPVKMKETVRYYLRNRGQEGGITLGLISDQSPRLRADSHWFRFLNQDTLFLDGSETLALKFHIPVYFIRAERVAPGRYRAYFDKIYDGVEEVAPYEITERYVRALEQMIRSCPELWLWSHSRWKHTPEKQERLLARKADMLSRGNE